VPTLGAGRCSDRLATHVLWSRRHLKWVTTVLCATAVSCRLSRPKICSPSSPSLSSHPKSAHDTSAAIARDARKASDRAAKSRNWAKVAASVLWS
jgi:hypothetical protein